MKKIENLAIALIVLIILSIGAFLLFHLIQILFFTTIFLVIYGIVKFLR
ncbi:MAG: hypothetical protein ABIP51_16910 [Bacteroidia bacterium]